MQSVKITKKTSVNISQKVPLRYIFNSDTSKYAQPHRFLLNSRLSCCKNLDVRSSPGLQRAPVCPCNVRAAGEGVRRAPPHTTDSACWQRKWKAGGPFHYWFIFNGTGGWDGAGYMATFTAKWLCSVWILMRLHVNTCIKYWGREKHLGLDAGDTIWCEAWFCLKTWLLCWCLLIFFFFSWQLHLMFIGQKWGDKTL